MKKLNRLAAVVLAAAFVFASALPAGAVVVTDLPIPDRVFYGGTAGDTFSGGFTMDKEITNVGGGRTPPLLFLSRGIHCNLIPSMPPPYRLLSWYAAGKSWKRSCALPCMTRWTWPRLRAA